MDGFWGRFLRYRFDLATLAFDCIATFFSRGRPSGRLLALAWASFMLLPPIFVLLFGNERFGNGWAFGLTLILFAVALEAPGHMWRREAANGDIEIDDGAFDRFLFALLTGASALAPFAILEMEIDAGVPLGVIWGVALIGAQDIVRSGIAFHLALTEGHPVYKRERSPY